MITKLYIGKSDYDHHNDGSVNNDDGNDVYNKYGMKMMMTNDDV